MIYVWQPQKYRNAHPSPQLISHLYLMHWQFQLDGPLWDIVIAAVTQTEGGGANYNKPHSKEAIIQ